MLVSTPYHIWELRYQGVDIWREIKNWLPCEGLNTIAFRCFKLLVWRNLSNENKHSISLKKKSFIDPKESFYSQKFYFSWRGQNFLRARQRVYAEHRTYAIFLCAYAKIFFKRTHLHKTFSPLLIVVQSRWKLRLFGLHVFFAFLR